MNIISSIATYRIESYLFFITFAASLKLIPVQQIIQDKICSVKFGFSNDFCSSINKLDYKISDDKNLVIADTLLYQLYGSLLYTLPGITMSHFIICNKNKRLKDTFLLFSLIGTIIETLGQLINSINIEWSTSIKINYINY